MVYEQFLKNLFKKKEGEEQPKGIGYDVLGNKLEKAPDTKTQAFDDKHIIGTKKINITPEEEKQLVSRSWKKVWEETIEKPQQSEGPKDVLQKVELKFNKQNYFELGGYLLNNDFKNALSFEFDKIVSNHTIVSIEIESSTDKTKLTPKLQDDLKNKGYTPDNPGLSKARSNEIRKFLTQKGVKNEQFKIKELSELGKEGGYDPEARYVKLNFEVKSKEQDKNLKPGDVVSYFQKILIKKTQKVPKGKVEYGKNCMTYE